MGKPRAKTHARRQWKVYRTILGFNDVVVAASSEKAVLAAWGSKVDLFREGLAAVVKNDKVVEKARCLPGIVLRREHGTADKFVFDTGVDNVEMLLRPVSQSRMSALSRRIS